MILGDELADGHVQLRDLLAGTQRVVALEDLARDLARAEQHHKHGCRRSAAGRPNMTRGGDIQA